MFFQKWVKILDNWRKHFKQTIIITVLIQVFQILSIYFIVKSLNLPIPFSALLIFTPLIGMIHIFPLTFFNIGVREGVNILLFTSLVGVSSVDCVSMAMLFYVVVLPSILIGFVLVLLLYLFKTKKIKQ